MSMRGWRRICPTSPQIAEVLAKSPDRGFEHPGSALDTKAGAACLQKKGESYVYSHFLDDRNEPDVCDSALHSRCARAVLLYRTRGRLDQPAKSDRQVHYRRCAAGDH